MPWPNALLGDESTQIVKVEATSLLRRERSQWKQALIATSDLQLAEGGDAMAQWHYCPCEYQTRRKATLKSHLAARHGVDVKWWAMFAKLEAWKGGVRGSQPSVPERHHL